MRKKKRAERQREQAKKARRWYFIKQKAYGLAMLAVTVLAVWATEGDIELLGRYQSRQYEKVLDAATGEREQRTAYEVSVRLIRRKEEAENEC